MQERELILDFSSMYRSCGFLSRIESSRPGVVDYRDLTALEGTSCYCDGDAMKVIDEGIAAGAASVLHWIDTGDYHYVSALFCRRVGKPYSLFLLDNHPDDQEPAFGGVLSCGSWVKYLRENDPCLGRVVRNSREGGAFTPEDVVYISVDTDIMSREYARTDWSQGDWTLSDVCGAVEGVFSSGARIAGIDICGGLSESKGATHGDNGVNCQLFIDLENFITNQLNKR